MDVRQDVFLIFKEAVHNAARHAHATRVQVGIAYADGLLQIRVTDNGSGFDADGLARRNGLNNMAHRAQRIGGTLSIESPPGVGTDVHLAVEIA